MNWTEVNIYTTTQGIEPVTYYLLNIGINGFVVKDANDFDDFLNHKSGNWDIVDDELMELKDCETSIVVYLPENSQGIENLLAIKEILKNLKETDTNNEFGRLEIELTNVKEEDWAHNWKQYFKPLTVGEKLVIKPSWEEYKNHGDRIILEIDPASSFGTGQHNTTQLCLELLEKTINEGDKVLDLGCGSGILSIAAILLGAEKVVAVDIEENAVATSLENAEKNNIDKDKYTAYCGNIISDNSLVEKIGGGYRIIVANIIADVLIMMSGIFDRFLTDDGILIMSGVISPRKDEVIDAVNKQGYELIEINEKDDWVAIKMKKQ